MQAIKARPYHHRQHKDTKATTKLLFKLVFTSPQYRRLAMARRRSTTIAVSNRILSKNMAGLSMKVVRRIALALGAWKRSSIPPVKLRQSHCDQSAVADRSGRAIKSHRGAWRRRSHTIWAPPVMKSLAESDECKHLHSMMIMSLTGHPVQRLRDFHCYMRNTNAKASPHEWGRRPLPGLHQLPCFAAEDGRQSTGFSMTVSVDLPFYTVKGKS